MADKKISELPLVTNATNIDEIIINKGGGNNASTSRISFANFVSGLITDGGIEAFDPFLTTLGSSDSVGWWRENIHSYWSQYPGKNAQGVRVNWGQGSGTFSLPKGCNAFIMQYQIQVNSKFSDPISTNPYYNDPAKKDWNSKTYANVRMTANNVTFEGNKNFVEAKVRSNLSHNVPASLADSSKGGNYPVDIRYYTKNHVGLLSSTLTADTNFPVSVNIDLERSGYTFIQINKINVLIKPVYLNTNSFSLISAYNSTFVDANDDIAILPPFSEQGELEEVSGGFKNSLGTLQNLIDGHLLQFPNDSDAGTLVSIKNDIYALIDETNPVTPFDANGNRLPGGATTAILSGFDGLEQIRVAERAFEVELTPILGVKWPFDTVRSL